MTELPDRSPRSGYILVLKVLVALMLILQVGLVFRADKVMLSRPYFEDTFYAMSVSRWLADGEGFSVDGIHPTNGVQPLVCLLYAPLFAVSGGDLYTALRLTLLLQIALFCFAARGGARFLVAASRREGDQQLIFWLAFALLYVNYALSIQFLNGLETGLTVGLTFLSLGLFNRLEEREEPRIVPYFGLGCLLGLTILARIDAGILAAALFLWKIYRSHRRYGKEKGSVRWSRFRQMVGQLSAMTVGAALTSGGWWLYNLLTFGNLIPVSGQSQQGLNTDLWLQVVETFNVFLEGLIAGIATPASWRISGVAWLGLLLPAVLWMAFLTVPGLRRAFRRGVRGLPDDWKSASFVPLFLTVAGLVLFYTFFFGAPHFQARYLVLLSVTVLLCLVAAAVSVWRRTTGEEKGFRLLLLLPFVPCLLSLAFFLRNYTNTYANMMVDTVDWIQENVGPEERVGIFQSGTVGFLFPYTVVNLDGKVNPDAFHAYAGGRLPEYVDSMNFDYIVDWQYYTNRIFHDPELLRSYRRTDTLGNFMEVWKRVEKKGEKPAQQSVP